MTKTLEYDLVIVGGGPAGSSAAYTAAKRGLRVALIEKESTISKSVRTSGVTWFETIKEFKIPKECYNLIKNYSFCSPTNQATIKDNSPRAAVLDVRRTFRWLAKLAESEGTDIFLKSNVVDITKDGKGNICGVKVSSEEQIDFHCKVVIDASGFQSVVAKSMGLVTQWSRFGAGAEWEAEVENVKSDTWWLMVGQKYSPAGYAWIFPLNEKLVRIGVGVGKPDSKIDPTERLNEIIEKKIGPIKELGKIKPIEFHYGLIPNDGLSRKTVYDNLILVGDSAGQANPLVLEGIRYAIRYGRLAGEVCADAIKSDDTSEKALMPYEEAWKKAIQSKIKSAGKVQERWIGLSDEQWDKEIDIIKELSPDEFLDFIKADFGMTSIIKLATHHPKLAVRQLFKIVKEVTKKS